MIPISITRFLIAAVLGLLFGFPFPPVWAADIGNGWSTSYTGGASCGDPNSNFWGLPMGTSDASKYKRGAPLAAYMASKKVIFRCEGSKVTDFHVLN